MICAPCSRQQQLTAPKSRHLTALSLRSRRKRARTQTARDGALGRQMHWNSRPQPPKPRRVKVVANLPYYITTEVLKLLLPLGEHVSHVAFMLQHEVALRLSDPHPCALYFIRSAHSSGTILLCVNVKMPGVMIYEATSDTLLHLTFPQVLTHRGACAADGGQYRPMTVFSHFFSKPEYMFKIDRSSYFPSPEVHGALAVFTLLPPEEREAVRSVREFQSFVRQAFSSKRKMIANSLQPRWHKDDISAAVAALSLSAKVRIAHHAAHCAVTADTRRVCLCQRVAGARGCFGCLLSTVVCWDK